MKNTETKAQFVELRGQGLSFAKISEKLEVSKPVLIEWSKELALEIGNRKALEIDQLLEKYLVTKQHRLEQYGKHLQLLREELKKRSFDDLPTERIFELYLKYSQVLKKEEIPVSLGQKVTLDDQLKNLNHSVSRWDA